ncbi:sigma-54-dependent Fis family transcriptional regulator [bacterium]|nr:sigma-54-dependent Fis family transcriptional regulator [bacterium]
MKKRVLIIDDEVNARAGLRRIVEDLGCEAAEAASGADGLAAYRAMGADLVLTDLRMPGASGMTVLETLHKEAPALPVLVITAYGSGDTAREALEKGAFDFISKPFDIDTIELVIRRALKMVDLASENSALREALGKGDDTAIIGESPQMQRLFEVIRQVAPTKSNVLIEGESGTGKELIARAIHNLSPRRGAAFVPVHCASFSESLLESELFGHEKGAFTGAVTQRRGRFELAHNGTLFLDEVSTIALPVQVKLLRVLQERQFERVGGSETLGVDVRLIAATNVPLKQLIENGSFREDLYYRLSVVNLRIPPLRERRSDVALLIAHFLERFNRETGRTIAISKVARQLLEQYDWPGNVRELQNTIEALVVLCQGREVTPRDLPKHILSNTRSPVADQPAVEMPDIDGMTLANLEKWAILRKLDRVKTRSDVARQLGISRRNLYRRLKEYGVIRHDEPEER